MDRFDSALCAAFREKINEAVEHETARMIGAPALDYPDYQHRVGLVRGLMQSIKIMETAQSDLGRDKPSEKEEGKPRAPSAYEA